MIFVLTNNLKPGMTLARDIWGQNSFLPLVWAGNKLTQKAINNFISRDILGAYIEYEGTGDIEVNEIFPMEIKVRVTAEIRQIFQTLQDEKGRSFLNVKALNHVADYIVNVISENDECMMNMIDIKNYNEYAYVHSMQVSMICVLIGRKLKFSSARLKDIAIAGMLHDLGKTCIPLEILDKEGPLTDDEMSIMRQHPSLALTKLMSCKTISKEVIDGIGQHHEKMDGTGYPHNLPGSKISEFAKIISIADVYDALTTDRAYRPAWNAHKSIDYMMSCSDSHFDVDYLNVFLSIVSAYPIGVLVKLNIGLTAVVIGSNEGLPLTPIVKILTPGEHYERVVNLANDLDALTIQISDVIKDDETIMDLIGN